MSRVILPGPETIKDRKLMREKDVLTAGVTAHVMRLTRPRIMCRRDYR